MDSTAEKYNTDPTGIKEVTTAVEGRRETAFGIERTRGNRNEYQWKNERGYSKEIITYEGGRMDEGVRRAEKRNANHVQADGRQES